MDKTQTGKRRLNIGFILDTLEENYEALLLSGIVDCTIQNDINLIMFISATMEKPHQFNLNYDLVADIVSKENLDGLIVLSGVMGFYYSTAEIKKFIACFKPIPVVCIAIPFAETANILGDNETGITELIHHLIEAHKCKRIAFVCGPEGHSEAEARFNAYKKTLVNNNIEYDEKFVVPGHFSYSSGKDAVKILTDERKLKMDAIIAANDVTALGVIDALYERGIRVPYDIAVAGFDNIDEAKLSNPPLTTVGQQFYEQGKKAVENIVSMIHSNTAPENIVLSTDLIIRESCGCLSKNILKIKQIEYASTTAARMENTDLRIIQKFLSEALDEFNNSPVETETLTKWLGELLDSLLNIWDKKSESAPFILVFNDMLVSYVKSGGDIAVWHNVLSILRNHCLEYLHDIKQIQEFEFIFERARVMISDIDNRNHLVKIAELEQKNWLLREISKSLIITYDFTALLNLIEEALRKLDISSCLISLYDNAVGSSHYASWTLPEKSKLIFAYFNKQRMVVPEESTFFTKTLIPEVDGMSLFPRTSIFMPLHSNDEHLGFIIFEYSNVEKSIYETLRSHISTAIKGSILFHEQKQTHNELMNALEELDLLNKKFKDLSLKDELTSLFNRRGFFEFAQKHFTLTQKFNSKFLLLYIDLDKLKLINDTYGHNEGDEAIKAVAQILRRSFREIDIIGRISGDEFIVLVTNGERNDFSEIKRNIQANIHDYNSQSQKPYHVSVSIGMAAFKTGSKHTLDQLVAEADMDLYKEKQKKRVN